MERDVIIAHALMVLNLGRDIHPVRRVELQAHRAVCLPDGPFMALHIGNIQGIPTLQLLLHDSRNARRGTVRLLQRWRISLCKPAYLGIARTVQKSGEPLPPSCMQVKLQKCDPPKTQCSPGSAGANRAAR